MKREMMKAARIWLLLAAICSMSGALVPARASLWTPVTQRDLFRQAELIFEGTVVRIESRLSDRRNEGDAVLPHTFVTFRSRRTFKGRSETRDAITLRFAGGPGRGGRFLEVVGVPRFELGERDILFVKGNGTRICPLVGCGQGRFRVVDDVVLTEHGRSIWQTPDGRLSYGPVDLEHRRPPSPRPGQPAIKESSVKPGDTVSERDEKATPSRQEGQIPVGKRLGYDAFAKYITERVAVLHTQQELKALKPAPSADVKARFYVPAPKPAPLQIEPAEIHRKTQGAAAEQPRQKR